MDSNIRVCWSGSFATPLCLQNCRSLVCPNRFVNAIWVLHRCSFSSLNGVLVNITSTIGSTMNCLIMFSFSFRRQSSISIAVYSPS